MTTQETIGHLNDLIAAARDGENGYEDAAHHVNEDHLQTVFNEYAKQRAGFVKSLQSEVERLGGTPNESGTLTAAVHRGWLDLKSALSGGNAGAIVAACETGEDAAEAAFERVVNTDITGAPRTIVEKQWRQIQEAHKRLLHMKNGSYETNA